MKLPPRNNGPAAGAESSYSKIAANTGLGVKTTIAVGRRYMLKQ